MVSNQQCPWNVQFTFVWQNPIFARTWWLGKPPKTVILKDVTKTGNGERGTGSGSLGTSCQRKPPQKSKMTVQKTRERKKKTKKGIHVLVEIRWGRNCKSDFHFTFTFWAGGILGLSFRDTWHSHYSWITPFTLDRRFILPIYPPECSFSHSDKLLESKGFIQAHYMPCFENAW